MAAILQENIRTEAEAAPQSRLGVSSSLVHPRKDHCMKSFETKHTAFSKGSRVRHSDLDEINQSLLQGA